MKRFHRFLRLDLFLLLLSIGLSIFIYYSPSIVVGHMDWKGTVNGSSSKEAIFVLPAVSLFIYVVFNLLEKSPSLLIKRNNYDDPEDTQPSADPRLVESTLFYWRILKLLGLCSMDCILIVTYFPRFRVVMLVVIGLFMVYNISYLFKSLRQSK